MKRIALALVLASPGVMLAGCSDGIPDGTPAADAPPPSKSTMSNMDYEYMKKNAEHMKIGKGMSKAALKAAQAPAPAK